MRHLGEMNVRVDEARQDEATTQVADRSFRMGLAYAGVVAAGNDTTAVDRERAVGVGVQRAR